jgi:hypothetical protein
MRWKEGNNNYCFVDLKSSKEAGAAIAALDKMQKWGWTITVNHATGTSGKRRCSGSIALNSLPKK